MSNFFQTPRQEKDQLNLSHTSPSGVPSIMWIGGAFDESTVLSNPAVSTAANRWQLGLVHALQRLNVPISIVGHIPEPLWPKGRLRISKHMGRLDPDSRAHLISYKNIPLIRDKDLTKQYRGLLRSIFNSSEKPQALITYNAAQHVIELGLWAQEHFDIPWICIIADVPSNVRKRKSHDISIGQAAGRVFLSWKSYQDCNKLPKYHLDGAVTHIRFDPYNFEPLLPEPPVILYTGTLSHWGGVDLLVKSFSLLKHNSAELWVCGKGSNSLVAQAAAKNVRIKYRGLVSNAELNRISERATIFVNPRPAALSENHANFPSKLLEYLSYGKPVISTWTGGIAPEYRELLVVVREESEVCLAQSIDDVLSWSRERRKEYAFRVGCFLEKTHLWDIQARYLLAWIDQEILT